MKKITKLENQINYIKAYLNVMRRDLERGQMGFLLSSLDDIAAVMERIREEVKNEDKI